MSNYKDKLLAGATRKRITKAECIEIAENYHAYAQTVNPYVKPTKGVSSGTHGNDGEMQIKLAFHNYAFVGVADRKRPDTFKKVGGVRTTFEIKTGCGELGVIDENGNMCNNELTADYICYCPKYDPLYPADEQYFIMPAEDFIDLLNECGLIRLKMSTAMTKRKNMGEFAYYDRIAIQTFLNSKKKTEMLYSMLDGYDTAKEWIAENL